uniref:PKP93L n=1 Tax=African swine fever virus TaxID=10497 RepID=A0A6G7KT09_ASF
MFFLGFLSVTMDYWSTKVKIYSYTLLTLLVITLICYLIHILCKLRMKKNSVTNNMPPPPPPYTVSSRCSQYYID